ncbi:hypothetical protein, partial [Kordiimonas sp.]|uniref:hypothetical protein n=1 Tax=Kordiimonas sp. TaxID=1970157 RepID=UPI003A8D58E2
MSASSGLQMPPKWHSTDRSSPDVKRQAMPSRVRFLLALPPRPAADGLSLAVSILFYSASRGRVTT